METIEKMKTLAVGLTGMIGSAGTDVIVQASNIPVSDWTAAITQVLIAVATLIGLFKKRKK